jgi:hypothetical protein
MVTLRYKNHNVQISITRKNEAPFLPLHASNFVMTYKGGNKASVTMFVADVNIQSLLTYLKISKWQLFHQPRYSF